MPDPTRYDEFVDLLQRSTGRILAYIHALLLDWNDAEDVFQDSCVVLWQKFDEFQPGTNFVAWALRIAQNKALDFRKGRARRHALWKPEVQQALLTDVAQPQAGGEEAGLDALSGCMDKLDDGDRQLIQRCHGDGVPVRQIADQMGRSPQSVHNSLRRIRLVLLECIRRIVDREDRE
jgi:RNA polymerase sigma-70 factor, ECF subfamily